MSRTKTWLQPQPREGGNHEVGTWRLNKPAELNHLGPWMSYVPCVLRMEAIPVFPKQLITKHRISSQTNDNAPRTGRKKHEEQNPDITDDNDTTTVTGIRDTFLRQEGGITQPKDITSNEPILSWCNANSSININDTHACTSQSDANAQRINILARKAESGQIRSNPAWSEAGQGEVTY